MPRWSHHGWNSLIVDIIDQMHCILVNSIAKHMEQFPDPSLTYAFNPDFFPKLQYHSKHCKLSFHGSRTNKQQIPELSDLFVN